MLFGEELLQFANFGRSFTSVFRIMLGDFDWDSMAVVGRMEAGLWFWTFMLLVNLIMLNMLLAIIMDVYTQVKGGIGDEAQTVFRQVIDMFARAREEQAKRQLPLSQILQVLDPTTLDVADD